MINTLTKQRPEQNDLSIYTTHPDTVAADLSDIAFCAGFQITHLLLADQRYGLTFFYNRNNKPRPEYIYEPDETNDDPPFPVEYLTPVSVATNIIDHTLTNGYVICELRIKDLITQRVYKYDYSN